MLLADYVRHVSLIVILCRLLAIFVTLALCMLGGAHFYVAPFVSSTRPVMMGGTQYMDGSQSYVWYVVSWGTH